MIQLGGSYGAATRAEVAAVMGERAVRTALATGVLKQPWRGVVVHAVDAANLGTRAAAALLATGGDAVLSGPTALELHGLTAAVSTDTHITLGYSRSNKRRPGLVVHQNRFDPDDVVDLAGLPVFCLARTVADFLCDGDKMAAFACLDQALAGLTPEHDRELRTAITRRLRARSDRRGVARALMLVDMATGKADSPPESMFRLLVVEAGFPLPEAQHEIFTVDGRLLYALDMAWPEVRVALEYDGYAAHEDRMEKDAERDSRMAARGWVTIRATSADLGDPRRIFNELREAFAKRSG